MGAVFPTGLYFWIGSFLGATALSVLVTQIAQVGINFADDPFGPKFEKLNPLTGLQNIFSVNRLTQTGQSVVKLCVVGGFAYLALQNIQNSSVFARPVSLEELGKIYTDVAWSLGWRIVLVLGALSAADYTLAEVEIRPRSPDDFRGSKGGAEVAGSLARGHQETPSHGPGSTRCAGCWKTWSRPPSSVTNPTHYAVALRYRRGETEVPIVVAKGIRANALRIKERAYDLRIAVREDKPLARGLYKYGKIGQPIPSIFYQGVAIILASLYRQGFQASDGRPAHKVETTAELDEIFNQEND